MVLIERTPDNNLIESQHQLPSLLHERIAWMHSQGVTHLICGALSRCWQLELNNAGIHSHPFISGTLTEVIHGWHNNKLNDPSFAMPGCCGRQGRGRGRGTGRGYGMQRGIGRGMGRGMGRHRFQNGAAMHINNNKEQNKGE